jgi:hypothetical protein
MPLANSGSWPTSVNAPGGGAAEGSDGRGVADEGTLDGNADGRRCVGEGTEAHAAPTSNIDAAAIDRIATRGMAKGVLSRVSRAQGITDPLLS